MDKISSRECVYCYIDGYNLYRSIREFVCGPIVNDPQQIWLDYFSLAENFCNAGQEITQLYYCSAPYKSGYGNPDKVAASRKAQKIFCRHHLVHYGRRRFRIKYGYFQQPQDKQRKPREKQTDVNLAALVLDQAHRDKYDQAFVFTGDSDFIPIIGYLERLGKKILFIVPPSGGSKRLEKHQYMHGNMEIRQLNGGHIREAKFDPGPNAPDPREIY